MGFLFGLQLATVRMVPNSRPAERAAWGVVNFRSAKREVDKTRTLFTSSNCGGESQFFVVEGAILGS
jgi:hypothetical protein